MSIEKYLNNYDGNCLRRFAFIGTKQMFDRKLKYLESLAEPETWRLKDKTSDDFNVLFYYIIHTFDQCFKQNKIVVSDDEQCATFNTGLMSESGEEIYCIFTKSQNYDPNNPSSNFWYLEGFFKSTDRKYMNCNLPHPEMATYFQDYNELYFDPTYEIVVNFDHIYDDNFDRLPSDFQQLDKAVAGQAFTGFLEYTKKRIRRNSRIPVPQYYHDEIMFLIPVNVFGKDPIVLALEKRPQQYRANTILTMNMAYNCARLLTKPESNWLLPK